MIGFSEVPWNVGSLRRIAVETESVSTGSHHMNDVEQCQEIVEASPDQEGPPRAPPRLGGQAHGLSSCITEVRTKT